MQLAPQQTDVELPTNSRNRQNEAVFVLEQPGLRTTLGRASRQLAQNAKIDTLKLQGILYRGGNAHNSCLSEYSRVIIDPRLAPTRPPEEPCGAGVVYYWSAAGGGSAVVSIWIE